MQTQTCKICKVDKPATTEYFEPMEGNISGLRYQCKECRYIQRHGPRTEEKKTPAVHFNVEKADVPDAYDTEADLLERELSLEMRDDKQWPISLAGLDEESDAAWDKLCDEALKGDGNE